MDGDPVLDAPTAMQLIDRLCARVHVGVREERLDWPDAVELACELLDWGHDGEAVREVVERSPAHVTDRERADLARRILQETGFDPGFALAPERLEVLRRALRIAARDLPTAGISGEPRLVLLEDSSPVSMGVELPGGRSLTGSSTGLQAWTGDTLEGAVTAVADLLQDDLMERRRKVWPICPDHGLGVHARTHRDAAVWWCSGSGGHMKALIGELSAPGAVRNVEGQSEP